MFKVGDKVKYVVKNATVDEWTLWTIARVEWIEQSYCIRREWFTKWHNWCDFSSWNDGWSKTNDVNYRRVSEWEIELVQENTLTRTIAVHCPEERQAKKLMQEAERLWWRWWGWKQPTSETYWDIYKENTVYYLDVDKTLSYADHKFAKQNPEKWALHSFEWALNVLWVPPMTATEVALLKWDYVMFPEVSMTTQPRALIDESLLFKPKKMSMLNQNLRDRFFKKEETKIYELIEDCQEKFEPLNEILDYFTALKVEYNEIAEDIDDDIECNDKKELKKDKKRLEERYKKVFADKLTEQFVLVGKKIIK